MKRTKLQASVMTDVVTKRGTKEIYEHGLFDLVSFGKRGFDASMSISINALIFRKAGRFNDDFTHPRSCDGGAIAIECCDCRG
jgi:hypothetical protein